MTYFITVLNEDLETEVEPCQEPKPYATLRDAKQAVAELLEMPVKELKWNTIRRGGKVDRAELVNPPGVSGIYITIESGQHAQAGESFRG